MCRSSWACRRRCTGTGQCHRGRGSRTAAEGRGDNWLKVNYIVFPVSSLTLRISFPRRGKLVPRAWEYRSQSVGTQVQRRSSRSPAPFPPVLALCPADDRARQIRRSPRRDRVLPCLGRGGVIDVGGFLNLTALHEFSKQN